MVYWIRRIAAALGLGAFFMLFLIGLAGAHSFGWDALAGAFIRAFAGAALFWVVGIVIADILLKGIITDITIDQKCLVEGGLVQQVHSVKQKIEPGGSEMPFSGGRPAVKNDDRGEKF